MKQVRRTRVQVSRIRWNRGARQAPRYNKQVGLAHNGVHELGGEQGWTQVCCRSLGRVGWLMRARKTQTWLRQRCHKMGALAHKWSMKSGRLGAARGHAFGRLAGARRWMCGQEQIGRIGINDSSGGRVEFRFTGPCIVAGRHSLLYSLLASHSDCIGWAGW